MACRHEAATDPCNMLLRALWGTACIVPGKKATERGEDRHPMRGKSPERASIVRGRALLGTAGYSTLGTETDVKRRRLRGCRTPQDVNAITSCEVLPPCEYFSNCCLVYKQHFAEVIL